MQCLTAITLYSVVHAACDHGLVLHGLASLLIGTCISGFVNNVMFSCNGHVQIEHVATAAVIPIVMFSGVQL